VVCRVLFVFVFEARRNAIGSLSAQLLGVSDVQEDYLRRALADEQSFLEAVEVRVQLLQSLAVDIGQPGEAARLAGAAIAEIHGDNRAVLEHAARLVELLNAWESSDERSALELVSASSGPRRAGLFGGLNTACLYVLGIQADRLGTTTEALLQTLGPRFA
jgi:hypothetical protein